MYTILIRISVGLIFISEGIQKFLFSAELGEGRFLKIGIPFPAHTAPFVGVNEIVFGLLVLIGYKIKQTVLPLIAISCVAIIVTKLQTISEVCFWSVAHDARTDFAMLLNSFFLLLSGSGKNSLDDYFHKEGQED